jgi:hypothetical protein
MENPGAAVAAKPKVEFSILGKGSTAEFPMIEKVWDMFASKGIRTVFLSVGTSSSALADMDLAESLGCPLHAVALSQEEKAKWEEVTGILKERKRDASGCAATAFTVGVETKWVLPKNIRIQEALPWWTKGELQIDAATPMKTVPVQTLLQSVASGMKIKQEDVRVDILKIDTVGCAPGLERGIIQAVLDAGFRPCILLVNWSEHPDVHLPTCLAAGHLQNCGYWLMKTLENKFLYYFTDNDVYQICSWENTRDPNPMTAEFTRSIMETVRPQAVAAANSSSNVETAARP